MSWKVAQIFVMPGRPDYEQLLKQAGMDVTLTKRTCENEDEIIATANDADAVMCSGPLQPLTQRVLEKLVKCRLLQTTSVGYEGIDVAAATELGIIVSNVPDYCLEEVSDHVMALILACTRRVVALNEAVKAGKWTSVASPYIREQIWPNLARLRGQTLGLMGFGRIPQSLVPKAKGFGLRVLAHDPYMPDSVFEAQGVIKTDFDSLIRESDIISLHAPLNKDTKGLMGAEQFEKMKPTAYIINTARGPLIKTEELYDCLTRGVIAGAALDVTDPEPISADDPIVKLDNVIITAHAAGASPTAMAILWSRPVEEMVNVLVKNQWPVGIVNPKVKEAYIRKWGNMV